MTDAEMREIKERVETNESWPWRHALMDDGEWSMIDGSKQARLDALALLAEVERLRKIEAKARALEQCPECNIKALDCGHAEELHDALEEKG